jgi:hypothetical protein
MCLVVVAWKPRVAKDSTPAISSLRAAAGWIWGHSSAALEVVMIAIISSSGSCDTSSVLSRFVWLILADVAASCDARISYLQGGWLPSEDPGHLPFGLLPVG